MLNARDPFSEFIPAFMNAKRLSPMTQRDYGRYLREFDEATEHTTLKDALTLDNAARFVSQRLAGGPFAAHNAALALKSFATWTAKSKYIRIMGGGSPLAGLEAPKTPKSTRTAFTDVQVAAIFAAIEGRESRDRLRSRAYFWLLFATGLRKNEARQLALADMHLDPETNRSWIHVRAVTSKGMKERRVRLDRIAVAPILEYINATVPGKARPAFTGEVGEVDTLFLTESGKPFTYAGFSTWADRIFADVRKACGVPGSSHVWRHTWATQFHRASGLTGLTVYDLKEQGGWADLAIPLRYTHSRPWEEMLDMPSHLTAMAERRERETTEVRKTG